MKNDRSNRDLMIRKKVEEKKKNFASLKSEALKLLVDWIEVFYIVYHFLFKISAYGIIVKEWIKQKSNIFPSFLPLIQATVFNKKPANLINHQDTKLGWWQMRRKHASAALFQGLRKKLIKLSCRWCKLV